MPTTHTYRPLISQNPAKILRIDTDNMRRFPARHGVSSPVQPLKGLWETRAASISYRALAPGGAGFCYRICTGTSESRPTAHYSLLTANSTYTFSAKERDSETGLSYFGSRYYSSDLSIWLSVDPMSGKYPSLSPYVYCADNPVRVVDPDGEEIYEFDENGKYLGTSGAQGSHDQIAIKKSDGSITISKGYENGTIKLCQEDVVAQEDMTQVGVRALKINDDAQALRLHSNIYLFARETQTV